MINSSIYKLRRIGTSPNLDTLIRHRVILINDLALLSLLLSVVLTITVSIEGLYPQNLIISTGIFLFAFVFYLNDKKQYKIASIYYLALAVLINYSSTIVAFQQGRQNEIENILIGFMIGILFLYDGKIRKFLFFILYLLLISLKVIKESYFSGAYDLDFYLTIQNTTIACLIAYLFANAFRRSLLVVFSKAKNHERTLYSLIDNVPIFMAMVDLDGRYVIVNKRYETFGMNRLEIIGKRIDEVLPPDILKTHKGFVALALEGKSPEFQETVTLPGGQLMHASGKYVPIYNDQNEVIGATVYVDDVTKLQLAKQHMAEANKAKDKIFSILAHDIRSPLNLFDGILGLSIGENLSQKQFLDYQNRVREKLGVLRTTVDELLDWTRVQMDGIQANPSFVSISPLIKESLVLYQDLIEAKGIDFTIHSKPELEAWIDINHLKIALRNIVHNAVKFTESGGKIVVEANSESGYIQMLISDNGTGMNDAQVKSIMNRELQKSQYGTNGELGTGIGLNLSLGLLELNQCLVAIDSKEGIGTKISLRIPDHPYTTKV